MLALTGRFMAGLGGEANCPDIEPLRRLSRANGRKSMPAHPDRRIRDRADGVDSELVGACPSDSAVHASVAGRADKGAER